MRLVKIMERGGDELYEYKKALKKAKEAIEMLCDLSDDMEDKYSRRSYRRDEHDWDDDDRRR
jgi:hypothetical protein